MTFDFTINVTAVLTVTVLVAGGIAAWVSMRGQVLAHSVQISTMVAQMKMNTDRVEDIRAKTAHELAEFKLQVAKEYATNATIREIKDELVGAIKELGDRINRKFDTNRGE